MAKMLRGSLGQESVIDREEQAHNGPQEFIARRRMPPTIWNRSALSAWNQIKSLGENIRRQWNRLNAWFHLDVYIRYFRPGLYRVHSEAIQTLLRDIGYVDRTPEQEERWRKFIGE